VWSNEFLGLLQSSCGLDYEPIALDGPLAERLTIEDPVRGRIQGRAAVLAYVAAEEAEAEAQRRRWKGGAITSGVRRVAGEFTCELASGGATIALPVAVIREATAAGGIALRIYHSTYPLTGTHRVRAPLLPSDPKAGASDIVGEYFAALSAGDAERIVATFAPDGYFREPSGGSYVYRGHAALLALYRRFFRAGGGIRLEHCTATEDGIRSVTEFTCVRWGRHDLPPQAGAAIYTRDARGKIASAHVYDDVTPPLDG
jgi:ketosteroid isomerase-like protein